MNEKVLTLIKEDYNNFEKQLKNQDWKKLTEKYKNFLKEIPLMEYRQQLQAIKTIEFNISGKYRSLHLSLIYHHYWKEKNIKLIKKNENISGQFKKLKQVCNFLNDNDKKIPLYKILGNFGFDNEKEFLVWLYTTKYSNNPSPKEYIKIEQQLFTEKKEYMPFEQFWKEYKHSINLDDFIKQHEKFINLDLIISQIAKEIKNKSIIFDELKKEDIDTQKSRELIKGFILVGLKARIYRTWVSLLTQLDFCYTWNKKINKHKIDSDVILDLHGIDLYGKINNVFFGLQIKKKSKRQEAQKTTNSERPIKTFDIYYDLNFKKDNYLKHKLKKYPNGFVTFTYKYANDIYKNIKNKIKKK